MFNKYKIFVLLFLTFVSVQVFAAKRYEIPSNKKNTNEAKLCEKSGGRWLGTNRNIECDCRGLGIPGEISDERTDMVGSKRYGKCVCRYARGFDEEAKRCQFTQTQLNKCDTSLSTPDKYKGCICKNNFKEVWDRDDINTCEAINSSICEAEPGKKWDEKVQLCTCTNNGRITKNNKCEEKTAEQSITTIFKGKIVDYKNRAVSHVQIGEIRCYTDEQGYFSCKFPGDLARKAVRVCSLVDGLCMDFTLQKDVENNIKLDERFDNNDFLEKEALKKSEYIDVSCINAVKKQPILLDCSIEHILSSDAEQIIIQKIEEYKKSCVEEIPDNFDIKTREIKIQSDIMRDNYQCVIKECSDGYKISKKGDKCIKDKGYKKKDASVDEYKSSGLETPTDGDATPVSTTTTEECTAAQLNELHASQGEMQDGRCVPTACADDLTLTEGYCIDVKRIQEAQAKYEEAKENEQSTENKLLTSLTTAATGIGGMELAQGLAEQKADKDAAADMEAYIATMRCTYADGKSVKAGPEEVQLPGGNNDEMFKLRSEYFALAADLKARKEALGLAPGIESEEILDKATLGLYDDENVGISDGSYASLYRSQMLDSETDKTQIEEDAKKSKTRAIAGGVAAGVGVVGGAVGDSLINGELGEKIKNE